MPVLAVAAGGVVLLTVVLQALSPWFPDCLRALDLFSMNHVVAEGASPTKRRTPQGAAFTPTTAAAAALVAYLMYVQNSPVVQRDTTSIQDLAPATGDLVLTVSHISAGPTAGHVSFRPDRTLGWSQTGTEW